MNQFNFCHLHRHCEASIQDGVGKVEDGVKFAAEMGHPAVAITDHGNLISFVRFYNEARAQNIKHIFGLEAYVTESIEDKARQYNHCTILVKNETGFKNLLKLNHIAQTKGFYYKPKMDWDTLLSHKEGLIILSGCVIGKTCQLILAGKYDEAEAWTRMMKKEMGEDYYMELMLSDFRQQAECNKFLLELSEKYQIPGVITGDAHYVHKEDYQAQKAMMLLASKATIQELEEQQRKKAAAGPTEETQEEKDKIWIFESDQYWMKDEKELQQAKDKWHSYYPQDKFEAHMNESGKIAEKVEIVDLDTSYKMPKADIPEGANVDDVFEQKLVEGMQTKGLLGNKIYEDRLRFEVEIIKKKNLVDYFLVTQDVIRWAKTNDVFVGPGRGSAGGSLVCYVLDIVEIDPIEHGLLFERFLDLGRQEMPDIDTDYEIDRRDDVKEYIKKRYGEDHVASICALGTFRARNIIRDIARVYGHQPEDINVISKLIPEDAVFVGGQLQVGGEEYNNPTINAFFTENPQIKSIAQTLFGQIRHISKHAAGVIITDQPLDECVATIHVGDDIMTAWTEGIYRKELSQLNVLKMDILGLKNLSILKKACQLAGLDYKKLKELPLDDRDTYEVISKNKLIKGIFQFDSSTGSYLFNLMKPKNFNDLVALGALDRPGPLDSGMAFEYIERNNGLIPVEKFTHPAIEKVLGETNGVIVFQEQLMNLAKELCGFDPIEASALRKNLVKIQLSPEAQAKVKKERVKLKQMFEERALKNGADQKTIDMLWDAMTKFARYGFNKAHSVGYAYITYWTMYMKTHYPLEFFSALLSYTAHAAKDEKTSDMKEILDEMRRMGLDIEVPDINKSGIDFTPDYDRKRVLYGFNKVKYLGTNGQNAILKMRPFTSFEDLCEKIPKADLNKKGKEALIRTGAFRHLESDAGILLQKLAQMSAKKSETIAYVPYQEQNFIEDQDFYLGMNLLEEASNRFRSPQVAGQYKKWKNDRAMRDMPEVVEKMKANSGEFKDPNTGIEYERFSGFVLSVVDRVSKAGHQMVELQIGVWEDKPMKLFIMGWDRMYNTIKGLKENQCISIAILKRKSKKDFPTLTHLKELT